MLGWSPENIYENDHKKWIRKRDKESELLIYVDFLLLLKKISIIKENTFASYKMKG